MRSAVLSRFGIAFLLFSWLLIAACGGGRSTDVPDSGADGPSPEAGEGPSTSFSADVYPLIAANCVNCHRPGSAGVNYGKLDMSTVDAAFPNLVEVPAQGMGLSSELAAGLTNCSMLADGSAGTIRVVPGESANSLLYLKVHGFAVAPPCGKAMPLNGELPSGEQDTLVTAVQTWIDQGAKP